MKFGLEIYLRIGMIVDTCIRDGYLLLETQMSVIMLTKSRKRRKRVMGPDTSGQRERGNSSTSLTTIDHPRYLDSVER
jgi:hypothetical protein